MKSATIFFPSLACVLIALAGCAASPPDDAAAEASDVVARSHDVTTFTLGAADGTCLALVNWDHKNGMQPELKKEPCGLGAEVDPKLEWQFVQVSAVAVRTANGQEKLPVFDGALSSPPSGSPRFEELATSPTLPVGYMKLRAKPSPGAAPYWLTCKDDKITMGAEAGGASFVQTNDRDQACLVGVAVEARQGGVHVVLRPAHAVTIPNVCVGTPHGDLCHDVTRIEASAHAMDFPASTVMLRPIDVPARAARDDDRGVRAGAEPFVLRRVRLTPDDTKENCLVSQEQQPAATRRAAWNDCVAGDVQPQEVWWVSQRVRPETETSILRTIDLAIQNARGEYLIAVKGGWSLSPTLQGLVTVQAPSNPGIDGSALTLAGQNGRDVSTPMEMTYTPSADAVPGLAASGGAFLRFERQAF